jgi:hypothetical protein
MSRFPSAGHEPVHIPQILYHWRKHDTSISQSGRTFAGSLSAIRSMLERLRSQSSHPERYEVAEYPLELGIADSYLRRKPGNPPQIHGIFLGEPGPAPPWHDGPRFRRTSSLTAPLDHDAVVRLRRILADVDEEYVLLLGAGVMPLEDDGLWDAIKLLELTPSLAAVAGPLVKLDGTVARGALVVTPDQQLIDPIAGRSREEPGPYSIALKPHCVAAPWLDLMLARRDDLCRAVKSVPDRVRMRNLGAWFGIDAARRGRRVAFDPLFAGQVLAQDRLVSDGIEALGGTWQWLPGEVEHRSWPRMGLAGFEHGALFHQ